MTHELKQIIAASQIAQKEGIRCVLATVVALDGSSYRRPGVRMLLKQNGEMIGAVSGGCVEKEVFRQAESVFKTGTSKVMTYDGRYRLGCEGILYILLEALELSDELLQTFQNNLRNRHSFTIKSFFHKSFLESKGLGTVFQFGNTTYGLQTDFTPLEDAKTFIQDMQPCFRLVIIGGEHDAVQLCQLASKMGWEVTVVVHPKEEKAVTDFPGALELIPNEGDTLDLTLDDETAVVLMTHSFVKDLKYLIALMDEKPAYFGLLGPSRRREKLFHELMEVQPNIDPDFLEAVHGPAGLDIGAETPQEIAISILAEIMSVIREKNPLFLKEKVGNIHS